MRILTVACALMLHSVAWAGGIAVVDFQRAVNETNEGKAAQKKLDTMLHSSNLLARGKAKKFELQKEGSDDRSSKGS